MRLKPKQSCVDCHFFMRRNGQCSGNLEEIKEPERKSLRQGGDPWASRNCELSCSFGVWDEGLDFFDFLEANRYQVIVETNRRGFCFWWPYHPGMLLPAAKILQEREAKNRDAEHDRSLTRRGLRIATFALFINAAALVINAAPKWIELIFFRRP